MFYVFQLTQFIPFSTQSVSYKLNKCGKIFFDKSDRLKKFFVKAFSYIKKKYKLKNVVYLK